MPFKSSEFNQKEILLETKLELLHKCLTPTGAKDVSSIKNFDLIRNMEIKNIGSQSVTVETFIKQFPDDGPFGNNYIKALTKLRDELLQDY